MLSLPPALYYLLGAAVLAALPQRLRAPAFVLVPALTFAALLALEPGMAVTVPFLDLELMPLRVDRLSLAFAYIFTLITFIGGFYALHLRDTSQQIAALLYGGSALGVVFAGDLLTVFVFWEIMAVASVGLVWARRTPESFQAGIRYLFVHLVGGSLLLAGIIWHYSGTGSILFEPFAGGAASWLILGAFAINAAIPPLHAWLADAYPQGTVTGSVFLSAFTTKTAVYVLARGFPGWEVLLWAGVIMALYGVIYAMLVNDIRQILAYHIISQVGFMVAGVGVGTEAALNGATAHAFTHILYKALLFMGAGAVLYTTGRSKLTELGGLGKAMPAIFGLYMVGALSISGFPLFSGFVSKPITVDAAGAAGYGLAATLLLLASVGTFLSVGLKLPYYTWFGPQREIQPDPAPRGMYIGMGLAAAIDLGLGLYPAVLYNVLPFSIDYNPFTAYHLLEAWNIHLFTALGFWLLAAKLGGKATLALDTDWFYRRPAARAYALLGQVERVFGATERGALGVVRGVVAFAGDPVGYTLAAGRWLETYFPTPSVEEAGASRPLKRDMPLGVGVLVIIACFVVLIAGFLAAV
jgi:multicomponent Na+:H+ antiporter subunit D